MKIAFVTFEYPPSKIGGAGAQARELTKGLAGLGIDPQIEGHQPPNHSIQGDSHNKNDTVLIMVGPDWGYRRKPEREVSNLGLTRRVTFIESVDGEDKIGAHVDANLFVHIVKYMGERYHAT